MPFWKKKKDSHILYPAQGTISEATAAKSHHKVNQDKAGRNGDASNLLKEDAQQHQGTFSDSKHVEKYGLFILHDQPSDEPGVVDIFAIHGLNGHYDKTWSTESPEGDRVNWLKDFLPQRIPYARILSYGYNSTVQFSKSAAGVDTFAEQLLEDILSVRLHPMERMRPILFICHSLGGIVFKKAIIRAHQRERFEFLRLNFCGVAFFGTPHRGSTLAPWGSVFANILKASSLGLHTNAALVRDLEQNSAMLSDTIRSFVDYGKDLSILSFYETDKMEGLNTKVVDEPSAVLGLPNETAIAINGDHRSICQFSSINSNTFRTVWTNLKTMADQTAKPWTNDDERFYNSLLRGDYESYRERNPERVEGTCEWLLNHKQYQDWEQKHSSAILWISADPGCGKSILMSFLVNHLKSKNNWRGSGEKDSSTTPKTVDSVCHFFFKDDNEDQRDLSCALSAILHQIFKTQPELLHQIIEDEKLTNFGITKDSRALWKMFETTVRQRQAQNITIILDGLDECQETSIGFLTSRLCQFYSRGADELGKRPFIKFIVTSRPENAIKAAFLKLPTIRLRGEDEVEAISKDVERVILANIEDLVAHGLPKKTLTDLQKRLVDGADRTFLWTTLMIKLLKDASVRGASRKEMIAILSSRDIYALYDRLLERSTNLSEATKMLRLVVGAARPLTLDEMNNALATDITKRIFDDLDDDLKHPFENYLKSLCGHFLRVIRSKVYFVHQTAREYLLENRQSKILIRSAIPASLIDLDSAHDKSLRACIATMYLLCSRTEHETRMRMGESYAIKCLSLPNHEFLHYASMYWPLHLSRRLEHSQEGFLAWYKTYTEPGSPDYPKALENRYLQGLNHDAWHLSPSTAFVVKSLVGLHDVMKTLDKCKDAINPGVLEIHLRRLNLSLQKLSRELGIDLNSTWIGNEIDETCERTQANQNRNKEKSAIDKVGFVDIVSRNQIETQKSLGFAQTVYGSGPPKFDRQYIGFRSMT